MATAPGAIAARPDIVAMRARSVADARHNALRRLVLAIVMLILSIVVFRRAFDWLNPRQAPAPTS